LFRGRVHPKREAASLSKSEVRAVHRGIRGTLNETLRKDSSDEVRYLHETDSENRFLVYGRKGEPCRRCSTRIERIVQGGRSTFYCPRCQRIK
jgi:formamidopyrimidine-DNA glycosylase